MDQNINERPELDKRRFDNSRRGLQIDREVQILVSLEKGLIPEGTLDSTLFGYFWYEFNGDLSDI